MLPQFETALTMSQEKCKMTDDGVYLYGQGEDSFCGPLPSEMDPENAAAIPWQAQKKLKEMSGNKTREEKLEESCPCPRR